MQTIKFGSENINYLGEILQKYKPSNILFLTGKSSFIKSGAKKLIQPYIEQYKFVHYSDFEENPKITDVDKIVSIFNDNSCDFIVAVGGGSVIDMAKLVNFFAEKKRPYISKFNESLSDDNKFPFVAIPTTSGTGSEATHFAVVYSEEKKYSIADKNLLPRFVFLLPEFTYNNPKYLSAVTGIDAFAQAVESFWSIYSTDESMEYSKKAIKLIWENLESVVNSNNQIARDKMMQASYLAGKAINITKTTAPHALSYGFTSLCGLPHGHAVALFLPFFIQKHIDVSDTNCNDIRGVEYVRKNMTELAGVINSDIDNLTQNICDFIDRCDIDINFDSLSINKDVFNDAIEGLSVERLANNPIKIEKTNIIEIYKSKYNND